MASPSSPSTSSRRRQEQPNSSVLVVRNLTARAAGTPILEDVSFTLRSGYSAARDQGGEGRSSPSSPSTSTNNDGGRRGDIAFIRGSSGGGKTALLRTVASLEPVDENTLLLDGLPPEAWGPARFRSRVCYVPQSRLRLPGSPADLLAEAASFAAQAERNNSRKNESQEALLRSLDAVAASLLLEPSLLRRPWETLSGGQAARASLAVAMALKPPFLLVDEPTAALDGRTAAAVERELSECGSGVLWVTHDEGQPGRVGGRVYELVPGEVARASGGNDRRGGEGDDGADGDDNSSDGDDGGSSAPLIVSPGKLVGGDWVGPKRNDQGDR